MEKEKDLIIFSNSPGEVSTWVKPVIEEICKNNKIIEKYRIFLIIHPCQFGTGREPFVAKSFPGIDFIIPPNEYLKYLITGLWKKKYGLKGEGIIFSLGGHLKHPVFFKKRVRAPYKLYAYTDNPDLPGWEKNYERIFVRNDYMRNRYINRGVSQSKMEIAGDLVYSTVKKIKGRREVRAFLGVSSNEKMIVFMPGSRDFEVFYMLPVFLKVIDELTERFNDLRIFILKSPYVTHEFIAESVIKGSEIKEGDTLSGVLQQDTINGTRIINFSNNKKISILEMGLEECCEGIDFAVTLPGSNNLQLAYRKIPHLVITPLNKPEIIPFVGVLSILKWVPIFGKSLLKRGALAYSKKFRFSARPNIYQNREIVPELFGVLKTEDITDRLIKIIENNEAPEIKKRLGVFEVKEDPAEKIVRAVWG